MLRHWLTTSSSEEFSKAAATLSLSASCLFTADYQRKPITSQSFIHVFSHTFSPTCFLGSVRPRSDVNINLRADKKESSKVGRRLKNMWCFHTLNLLGRQRSSLTLMDRPMSVAMLQWGMVGVNSMSTVLSPSLTCKPSTQV